MELCTAFPCSPSNICRCRQRQRWALNNCFGFIDGTAGPIARPGENQRVVYNGHKRVDALKFQSLALPNGMIANMFGPVGGFIFNHFHRWWQFFLSSMKWLHQFFFKHTSLMRFVVAFFERVGNMMPECWLTLVYCTFCSGMLCPLLVNPCAFMATQPIL